MRKILLSITALLLLFANSAAQEVESDNSSISIDGVNVDFVFKHKKGDNPYIKAHWGGLGFMFTGLKGLDEDISLNQPITYTVFFNLFDIALPLNNHWMAATGLGIDFSNYQLKNNVSLQKIDDVAQFVWDSEGRKYKDSRFFLSYLKVPLLLEYQWGRKNKVYINGGIEGMVKLYSKSQIRMRTDNSITTVDFGGLNASPVTFRFVAGFGYRSIGLTGYYHPLPLFAKGKGPELYPFGVGFIWTN